MAAQALEQRQWWNCVGLNWVTSGHLLCVVHSSHMESLQLPLLSLHSFALCYLSHRLGNTGSIVVSLLIVLFVPQVWNYKQHGCLFTHCVICPTGVELQAAWLSLHSLCYLSHRCGTTSSMAVSSFIVLFVPQVWNYKQHGCLFIHCVICPTGVELQAAWLSLHSLCYLSHRCGTTSSMAVSSFIVLFVPQVWNYKQHGCLFIHCVICPTGVELQAAWLSLHSVCYLSHRCGTTSSAVVSSLCWDTWTTSVPPSSIMSVSTSISAWVLLLFSVSSCPVGLSFSSWTACSGLSFSWLVCFVFIGLLFSVLSLC